MDQALCMLFGIHKKYKLQWARKKIEEERKKFSQLHNSDNDGNVGGLNQLGKFTGFKALP